MNNSVKKFIFLTILINIFLSVFANGSQDRTRQSFGSIQLKIVNLTNNTIKFYFNRLYVPIEIESKNEYITMNMLVAHSRTPLNAVVPSFIGIQYNDDENIVVYRFGHRISEMIFLANNQYVVVVKDSSVDFIEGNIDDPYDYFDESLYQKPYVDWHRERLGENFVEIKIENYSGSNKQVIIYSVYEDQKRINISDGMTEIYTIDDRIFSLGGIRVQVSEGDWTKENIILTNLWRRNSETSIFDYQLSNIKLQLNMNGYEISYY
jgi:hypothetical protein